MILLNIQFAYLLVLFLNTLITEVILQRHVPDILKAGISLGWLPKHLATDTMIPLDSSRPLIMRLMAM